MGNPDYQPSTILATGGAGFIGVNFIRHLLDVSGFQGKVVNYDKLTYAGNLGSLKDIDETHGKDKYFFEQGDICDYERVSEIFKKYSFDTVVHFAAESHVDRSIHGPRDFIETNVTGTLNLLEVAREFWADRSDVRFHHVSTDEVYGSLGDTGYFLETTPYDPRSPYSASKAASDHLVRAYFHTYGLPITISNCSNNYGPYQFPEKLIPLMLLNALEGKPLPVYGNGKNIRDWLYVDDHCEAIWLIINKGMSGETYNVGGECEKMNLEVVEDICTVLEKSKPATKNPTLEGKGYKELITFVTDRLGHDWRYAIDCNKIKNELGWKQKYDFEGGLKLTLDWYLGNMEWVDSIRTGDYKNWIKKHYSC